MTIKEIEIQLALGLLSENDLIDMIKPLPGYWDEILGTDIPEELLIYLSTHKYSMVRYYVADNSNTPIEVLIKLSKDENWCVRCNAECTIRAQEREKQLND